MSPAGLVTEIFQISCLSITTSLSYWNRLLWQQGMPLIEHTIIIIIALAKKVVGIRSAFWKHLLYKKYWHLTSQKVPWLPTTPTKRQDTTSDIVEQHYSNTQDYLKIKRILNALEQLEISKWNLLPFRKSKKIVSTSVNDTPNWEGAAKASRNHRNENGKWYYKNESRTYRRVPKNQRGTSDEIKNGQEETRSI